MRLALTVAVLAALAKGGDFESLHIVNTNFDFSKRVTLQLHGRLRTNHKVQDFYQARGGPVLLVQQNPRLQWIGGYYYIGQETNARQLFDQQRAFCGGQVRLWQGPKHGLDWRNVLERHFAGPVPDFWRYRTRMLFSGRAGARWQPYGSAEGLVARRIWTTRIGAGIGFMGSEGRMFLLGYEWRQYLTGPASHILTTTVQFPGWRARGLERR
jgi:hypothetical protein